MKIEKIRALDDGDLQVQLDKLRKELYELRVKASIESIDNPSEIGAIRKTIARLETVKRERTLEQARSES